MIKFECDTCKGETDEFEPSKHNGEYVPRRWITLSGTTVNNQNHSAALIYAGNVTMHFCSKQCFVDRFFKKQQTELTHD